MPNWPMHPLLFGKYPSETTRNLPKHPIDYLRHHKKKKDHHPLPIDQMFRSFPLTQKRLETTPASSIKKGSNAFLFDFATIE
jgi:hypothetical protein